MATAIVSPAAPAFRKTFEAPAPAFGASTALDVATVSSVLATKADAELATESFRTTFLMPRERLRPSWPRTCAWIMMVLRDTDHDRRTRLARYRARVRSGSGCIKA
eukprot:3241676-Prymnesium_polylepis.1